MLDLATAADLEGLAIPQLGSTSRTIHFVWVGTPTPAEVTERIHDWARLNPGFRVALWREGAIRALFDRGSVLSAQDFGRLWDGSLNPAAASDVARFAILHEFGGIYLDTDMDANRSLEPLLDLKEGFIVRESRWLLVASALGLPRGSQFSAAALTLMHEECTSNGRLDNYMSGPPLITELHRAFRRGRRTAPNVLDPWTFFPDNPFRFPRRTTGPEDPYGVHLFAHTWAEGGELSLPRKLIRLSQPFTPKDVAVGNRRSTQLRLRRRAQSLYGEPSRP